VSPQLLPPKTGLLYWEALDEPSAGVPRLAARDLRRCPQACWPKSCRSPPPGRSPVVDEAAAAGESCRHSVRVARSLQHPVHAGASGKKPGRCRRRGRRNLSPAAARNALVGFPPPADRNWPICQNIDPFDGDQSRFARGGRFACRFCPPSASLLLLPGVRPGFANSAPFAAPRQLAPRNPRGAAGVWALVTAGPAHPYVSHRPHVLP